VDTTPPAPTTVVVPTTTATATVATTSTVLVPTSATSTAVVAPANQVPTSYVVVSNTDFLTRASEFNATEIALSRIPSSARSLPPSATSQRA
jgi:hypothetical protein